MRDFKFGMAGWIQHAQLIDLARACDPRLSPIAVTFARNIARFESVWLLLPYLVDSTLKSAELTIKSVHSVLNSFDLNHPQLRDPAIAAQVEAEFFKQSIDWIQRHAGEDDVQRAVAEFNEILKNSPQPTVATGIETIFESQILNAWTAVEICLTDLWELTLNAGPADWTKRVMKSPPYSNAKESEKSINPSILYRFRFDLKSSMGTVLREKVDLETLREITEAFGVIFGKKEIDECVKDHLEGTIALEATRHLLTHKAGLVDAKFLGKTKNVALFRDAEAGKRLVLDGEIAGKLAYSGMVFAVALIQFVDAKLKFISESEWHPSI